MSESKKFNPPFATSQRDALTFNAFPFLTDTSARKVPRIYAYYKPPKLKKTKGRWYIEFWYRVPEELKHIFPEKWRRFRDFRDLNRYKSDDYANRLLQAWADQLENGYNPFAEKLKYFVQPSEDNVWSLNSGLDFFMEYCRDKKLRPNTIRSYKTLITMLKEYFTKDNRLYEPVNTYTKEDLKQFIKNSKTTWTNFTTNNYVTYLKVIFNWFEKEDVIAKSPAKALESLPVTVRKHKYYSDAIATKLKDVILNRDPELFEFLQMIYYCALRPKELRLLQFKHILFDRKLLFVPADISKNKSDDYIPLGEDELEMLDSRMKGKGIDDYIFGGSKPRSVNYFAGHYKPFKEKFNLDDDYTLYSWKHVRAIHLAQAGADPYQIMRLMRHSSLEITMKYLRELGLQDFSELHLKTKKF